MQDRAWVSNPLSRSLEKVLDPVATKGSWSLYSFLHTRPDTAFKELKTHKEPLQRDIFHGSCDPSTDKDQSI